MHIQRQADSFAYRMAASLPTEDELSGLQKEFDDWWDAIPEEKRPRPDGNCAWNFNNSPITSWENVEKFLSEHYPQAHSGAEWSEDAIGSAMGKNYPDYVRPVSDQRTLANMIMLHRRSQGLGLPNRGAWTPDEAALYNTPGMAEAIVKGRNKMQRDYEQRNMVQANTIRCAAEDYRGYHRGPDAEYGSSMDNPDGVFPDIDTHPEYYDTYQPYDYESHHQIRRVRGKPDAWVTVYRALPFSVIQNKTYRGGPNDLYEGSKPYSYRQREAPINTNDWVTPSYSYAKEHGESNLSNEPWTIVQQRVRARSLFSEGNSIHEWAYNGEPIVGTEGDRARRERGLRTRNRLSHNTIRCAATYYHVTSDPNFQISDIEPFTFEGDGAGEGQSQSGLYLTNNLDVPFWGNVLRRNGRRPYIVKIEGPDNLRTLPGVIRDDIPEQIFVPSQHHHLLKVQGVSDLKDFQV